MGEVRSSPAPGIEGESWEPGPGEETQWEILEVPAWLASQAPQLRILEPPATRDSWKPAAFPTRV